MKNKLVELKIPCGWEIIRNNFYDCECNMPCCNNKDKNSKVILHLERDVPIDRGDHFVIILERVSAKEDNSIYRITALIQELDSKKHLNKFENGDLNLIKDVFNKWIEELSQFLVDPNEVSLKLGYLIYSEFYNKAEEYPLMPLMIPSGWNIISNCFYDLDYTQSNLDRKLFSADMLFIKTSGINTSKGEYIISLDWLPYNDPEGAYVIQLAFVDFSEVIMKYKSRDRYHIKEKIFFFMDIIGSCNNKAEVIEQLKR
ncbi:hypothetical protein [Clostridium sp. C2-6-12]|uniref:hypothetical protein n=1 Tax=Clostridium sp. C2-6-12 TaxID=2698832 RepID=UPI00136C1366|nr:hypothetical protein [Clostridium sp. C2-6-12]